MRKKRIREIILVSLLVTALFSCKNNDDSGKPALAPTITTLSPTTAAYNTLLTITGTNFSTTPTENIVTINDIEVSVQNCTNTTLTILVPSLTEGSYPVIVTTKDGSCSSNQSFTYQYTIYAAGYESDGTKYVGKIWKNGVATSLNDATTINSLTVVGNDIYVAGNGWNLPNSNSFIARYWKNGVAVSLTNGNNIADALAIKVIGNDVYIVGYDGNVATYWKNGVVISLTNGQTYSKATGIGNIGNDIYITGYDGKVAKYWKNGVATALTDGTSPSAQAQSITVSKNNIYIAGYQWDGLNGNSFIAKYWKNGAAISLTNGNENNYAYGVVVIGSDVYVAGDGSNGTSKAKYWKNGIETSLTNGLYDAAAFCITAFGTDVYIGGFETNGNNIRVAKYWKNGVAITLSDGKNEAVVRAICIK